MHCFTPAPPAQTYRYNREPLAGLNPFESQYAGVCSTVDEAVTAGLLAAAGDLAAAGAGALAPPAPGGAAISFRTGDKV